MTNPTAEDEQATKAAAVAAKKNAALGNAVETSGAKGERKIIRTAPPGSRRARRTEKARRTGPFVKYVGEASHRKITPADWRSLGIEVAEDARPFTWEPANDKMIESSSFNDGQLDYLLIDDLQTSGGHSFLEVDYTEDGKLAQVIYEEEA